MRLVCPNCEAKYEVPEDAIPDVGRDVQCASCGHSWFQMRPRTAATVAEAPLSAPPQPAHAEPVAEVIAAEEVAPAVADAPAPVEDIPAAEPPVVEEPVAETTVTEGAAVEATAEPVVADSVVAEDVAVDVPPAVETPAEAAAAPDSDSAPIADTPAVEAVEATAVEAVAEETTAPVEVAPTPDADTAFEPVVDAAPPAEPEPEAEADPSPAPVAAAAYAVDESVLAILREEAEREVQARRAEARTRESQTDLGLDAAMPGKGKSGSAKPNGAAPSDDNGAALKSSARRDLLPDVEEINSTLRPSEVPVEDFIQPAPPPQEGRGFRSGFLMVMAVAIIGTAVYTAAPSLSVMVPALAGPLDAYVSAVDSLRLSLDGVMQSATVAINGG
jgi:resuscitation-promoting factor RpfA